MTENSGVDRVNVFVFFVCYNQGMTKPKPNTTAEQRKATPVFTGFAMYFPKAMKYVSQVSLAGNKQHHPDEPLHWDKSKSTDETDALLRHLIDAGPDGTEMDTDGILHAGKVAWRAMAYLERVLDKTGDNE